jgi:hypothetical protein
MTATDRPFLLRGWTTSEGDLLCVGLASSAVLAEEVMQRWGLVPLREASTYIVKSESGRPIYGAIKVGTTPSPIFGPDAEKNVDVVLVVPDSNWPLPLSTELTTILGEVEDRLTRALSRFAEQLRERDPKHPDGPEPPHWLWWKHKRYQIGSGRSALSWRLLDYFWNRDSARFEDLQGAGMPWSDPVNDSTIGTAVNRFANALPPGFPWTLATKNRCVFKESRQNPSV